jgi:dephospho-CoA kinase
MLKIGITGSIGCGKSHVCKFIQSLNYPVYSSDEQAKKIVYKTNIRKAIEALLGPKSYINGNYNITFIRDKIFKDDQLLTKLNSIIHPEVFKDFITFKEEHQSRGKQIVFLESALIFETGRQHDLDSIILIEAPLEIRLKRVMKRTGMTAEKFYQISQKQMSDIQKRQLANFMIVNDEITPFMQVLLDYIGTFN